MFHSRDAQSFSTDPKLGFREQHAQKFPIYIYIETKNYKIVFKKHHTISDIIFVNNKTIKKTSELKT